MKAIATKYHGPTDTRGSRISATDSDGNRATIPYPHELSGEAVHRKAATAFCEKMGWAGADELIAGSIKTGYVFVFPTSRLIAAAPALLAALEACVKAIGPLPGLTTGWTPATWPPLAEAYDQARAAIR